MIVQRPFETVTPTVDGDVLTVLARADASFTPPQVRAVIGRHSVEGVRRVLRRLVEQGIVDAQAVGHAVSYQLNRDHLAAAPIIELANLRQTLCSQIRDHVQAWARPAQLVMLFGSAAAGTMHAGSDIDLFVVSSDEHADADAWYDQIAGLERVVYRWTGNDTRTLTYRVSELSRPFDGVIDDVRRNGILIVGDRALLGQKPNRGS